MTEGAKQRFTLATMRFILRMQRFIAKYFMQSKALHFIISPPTHVRALHQTPHPGMRQTKHPTQVRVEFRPLYPCTRLSKKQATRIFPSLAHFFNFLVYIPIQQYSLKGSNFYSIRWVDFPPHNILSSYRNYRTHNHQSKLPN